MKIAYLLGVLLRAPQAFWQVSMKVGKTKSCLSLLSFNLTEALKEWRESDRTREQRVTGTEGAKLEVTAMATNDISEVSSRVFDSLNGYND